MVVVGSISDVRQYTVRRLDIECVITRVEDYELTPMHFFEKEAWSRRIEDYYWSARGGQSAT